MPNKKPVKIMVDLELLVNLSQATQMLFNIIKDKDLSDGDLEQLQLAGDLMQESTKQFENAINMTHNDN